MTRGPRNLDMHNRMSAPSSFGGMWVLLYFVFSCCLWIWIWFRSVVGDWLPGVLAGFLGGGCGGGCHWRLFAAAVAFLHCTLLIVCV